MTYLSYSGWKCYTTCPLQYWHSYVNKTRMEKPENGVNSLYGSTVGVVFENFYAQKIFKRPDYVSALKDLIEPTLDKTIQDAVRQGRVVDWSDEKSNYPENKDGLTKSEAMARGRKELIAHAHEAIVNGVNTIRRHKFVGPFMEAEMKLDARFGPHVMGGRADFVVQRVAPHGDLVIIDGKGSKHRDKYLEGKPRKKGDPVEGTQLKWYATLYREKFKRPPDALAYIFWRFADDKAVDWVPFTESDLDLLKEEALSTIKRIDRTSAQLVETASKQAREELREELFPTQAGHHCTLCNYSEICEAGRKYVAQIEGRKRKAKVTLPVGVTEFSLGLDDD